MNERIARLLLAAVLATTAFPTVTLAQSHPQPQRVLSRGVPDRPPSEPERRTLATHAMQQHTNDRVLYGRLDAMKADLLLVRSRSGRVVRVDASDAIKSGLYSAPLFVGKLMVITGYYDASRTLHAQTITRETRLDAATGPDR